MEGQGGGVGEAQGVADQKKGGEITGSDIS
jgi:hypothetical protein